VTPSGWLVANLTFQAARRPESRTETLEAFETRSRLQRQLAAGVVRAATIDSSIDILHATLTSGMLVSVRYPAQEEPRLVGQLRAKGVQVRQRNSAEPAARSTE
jgi:hypothetical protein